MVRIVEVVLTVRVLTTVIAYHGRVTHRVVFPGRLGPRAVFPGFRANQDLLAAHYIQWQVPFHVRQIDAFQVIIQPAVVLPRYRWQHLSHVLLIGQA